MYRLRPMRANDEAMILEARNSDAVRLHMLSQAIIPLAEHQKWMAAKLADGRCPYCIFEKEGSPVGVVGIARYSEMSDSGEWGFYLFGEGLPPGMGTLMLAAFLDRVFAQGLQAVTALVFCDNGRSMGLHEKLGFLRKGTIMDYRPGRDVQVWSLTQQAWQKRRGIFAELIRKVKIL